METTKLKEKDIVNKIVKSWDDYFPGLRFWKTEYKTRNFRVDIAADFEVDREAYGLIPSPYVHRAPVYFEVKYNSEMRDLIYELEKQLTFRNFYCDLKRHLAFICVISDHFPKEMVKYMIENDVKMFKINIQNDDIETLTIEEYKPTLTIEKVLLKDLEE